MESSRKRQSHEGEGEVTSCPAQGREQQCSSSRPPLQPPPLAKRSLEQETEMTNATVEQQGEPKRRREQPEVPQAAESRSSSSESSTDTGMGLLDVCTILCDKSEAKGRCEGGPITLDLTKWDFHKSDCRNKCR